jgi:hypothetical protein
MVSLCYAARRVGSEANRSGLISRETELRVTDRADIRGLPPVR